jgi:hypothetical protein
MKIGDLVILSAKGKRLKSNTDFVDAVGILMEINEGACYSMGIAWFLKKRVTKRPISWFKRYEIKKLKSGQKMSLTF